MKLRYIGPDDPNGVEVVCSGMYLGLVKPDETIDVPDDVYRAHAWSSVLWSEVNPVKAKKSGES